jgi:hypothetical protein
MSPYLYPPGIGWPSYTPGHWVHLKAEFLQNITENFSSYLTGNIVLSLTDSLWRRQSQQSFNKLTPFNFLFTHYMFRPLRAILRQDIQLFIWRNILIQRILCTYAISYRDVITCSPNTCYQIKYKK